MLIGLTDDFALFNSWVRLTTVFSEQADFTGEADCPQVDLLASFPSVGIQASSGLLPRQVCAMKAAFNPAAKRDIDRCLSRRTTYDFKWL